MKRNNIHVSCKFGYAVNCLNPRVVNFHEYDLPGKSSLNRTVVNSD